MTRDHIFFFPLQLKIYVYVYLCFKLKYMRVPFVNKGQFAAFKLESK